MARKKYPGTEGPPTTNIKIDREIARTLRTIALHERVPISEIVSELLGPAVQKRWAKAVRNSIGETSENPSVPA